MQRLFSTFPSGWPGIGLLLLRVCLPLALIYFAPTGLPDTSPQTIGKVQEGIAVLASLFLLAGLWTPLIGGVVALDQIWMALSPYALPQPERRLHVILAVLAVSVAMLGPGAWSIDARLFGRKRIDIDRRRSKRDPSNL